MNGLKQAAGIANIHLIICNTDEIENADEEKNLIYDQLDNQVDAFIVQAAPGRDTIDMLREIRVQSQCFSWQMMRCVKKRKSIHQNTLICQLLCRTITVWDMHWHRIY